MNFVKEQDFGRDPIAVRHSDHYFLEYAQSFASKWDELIDWRRRAESEGDFFINTLKDRGKSSVLDAATGTGFHSVRLLKAGFDVVSVDGSADMLLQAFHNAGQHGLVLKTAHTDWRYLTRDLYGQYGAIICLGNSFTHLFNEGDRRKTLAEFYAMLSHDGLLILDQRNYDHMLDKGFKCKHKYYYCGQNVRAEPEHLDHGLARFAYTFSDNSKYYLNMCPIRKDYVRNLMYEVGFQHVETYGDFQEDFHEDDPDFFIHIAEKFPQ
ncbi:MAG: class I SAM-dependent methyltransferase [Desulfohalobiaceae bacterium]|nr:class I SAM-dependent methyltransferase [Desulfohalobiaceae bacterium]